MGILNVTPDSFFDGRKYFQIEDAIKQAEKLINSGADIIDIGGESTRPNAKLVSEEEELRRVIPVVKELVKFRNDSVSAYGRVGVSAKFLISIDTYKSNVARLAINAGAKMINDVSGLTMDPNMVKVAAEYKCPVVIMHNEGIPATKPVEDVSACRSIGVSEYLEGIYNWLKKQTDYAMSNGIKKENIIIDPGIGFGKSAEEDLEIIQNLQKFKSLGFPILIGPSRKPFIKKLFGENNLEAKSKEITDLAVKNGADIVRVH